MTSKDSKEVKRYNRLTKIFGENVTGFKSICVHILAHIPCPNDDCRICKFDHCEVREHAIISEPYGLDRHEIKQVLDACEEYHLACIISSELSYHSIGYSVLIAVYNPNDVTDLYQNYLD